MRSEKTICFPSCLSKVSQPCLWNRFNVRLTDDGFISSFRGRSSSASSFSPGDRWCDVFGLVPTGSVSNSSTLHIFRDKNHLWWLLCTPVYLLGLLGTGQLTRVDGRTEGEGDFHSFFVILVPASANATENEIIWKRMSPAKAAMSTVQWTIKGS